MLELKAKKENYTNKDGVIKEYVKFYVEINGIELQVSPADNTVRQVLLLHFNLK